MAASVVYQGVGGGGDLFQGVKFHFLVRVPARKQWEDLVKANGGEVVPLEKQADIVIGDHARKGVPAGSISWTYIEQSVKKGVLEDIENHRAGPVVGTIRAIGSAQPTKKGKTPFTQEDDRVLMEWCARAEKRGASLKGNEIYKQLEEMNPRHPFQSWRDHWIKHLSSRPRLLVSDDAQQESGIHHDTAASPQIPRGRSVPTRAATASKMTSANNARTKPAVRRSKSPVASVSPEEYLVAKSAGGTNFTEQEDELLNECYDAIMNLDQDKLIDAWIAWAAKYPSHTAQEWRNRFNKEIKSKGKQKFASRNTEQPESPSREFINPPKIASSPELPEPKSIPRRSDRRPAQSQQVKDSLSSSGERLSASRKEALRPVDPALTNEDVFQRSLLGLADLLKVEVELKPIICGQRVPLFRLWQVVMSDEMGGFDHVNGRDKWPQVARELNFNDYRHSSAADDLKTCYSEILADFEIIREDFIAAHPDANITESQEDLMIESQLRQTANENSDEIDIQVTSHQSDISGEDDDEHDDDLDFPQSSPAGRVQSILMKRTLETGQTESSSSSFKRQRIDKGKGREIEIPSTPPPGPGSPPAASLSRATQTAFYKNMTKPSIIEPETQDFRFSEVQDEEESFSEIPPSPLQTKVQPGELSSTNATRGSGPTDNGSSTQSQTESQERRALEEYYGRLLSLSYSAEMISEALTATTMVRENAAFVMEALMKGEGIPDDMPGVWTSRDDKALDTSVESKRYRGILLKHGKDRIQRRKKFLADLNEVDMEGST